MPVWTCGNIASGFRSHCFNASTQDCAKPMDSSCGVVCALPTTKRPLLSTKNVSVIVPPASIDMMNDFSIAVLPGPFGPIFLALTSAGIECDA